MMKRMLCAVIVMAMLFALCSCGSKVSFKQDSLTNKSDTVTITNSFSETDDSAVVKADTTKAKSFIQSVKEQTVDYGYDEMFNCDKTLEGIYFDHTVANHQYSALNENGKLTKENLFRVVRENNKSYLADQQTTILEDMDDDDYLMRVCEIITTVTHDMLNQFPNIDKERLYCNLGYLKIINKASALDFAAVEPNMVLHMNAATSQMADIMQNASMYSVLVHETMHILQYGCSCENIDGCSRRCGLAHHFDEWEQDYADIVWLSEASAERMTCLYSKVEPMTYQNMVNYVVTMDLSTMLQDSIPANFIETLSFYDNPDLIFELFGCENDTDKKEIVHLLYALEMTHMSPEDVKASYLKYYGKELKDDEQDDLNNSLKRPILKTLTKRFYINLMSMVTDKQATQNDLYFLLNLFEDTINYHLQLNETDMERYNSDFSEWYGETRSKFFECLDNADYDSYCLYNAKADDKTINASMKWIDSEKATFLIGKYETVKCDFKIK